MQPRNAHPYSVRSQKDSLMGPRKYVVVRNPGGVRVTECPPSTQRRAWLDCDRLNILYRATVMLPELGLPWPQCWRYIRDCYVHYLPARWVCMDERIMTLDAYTDADMPEPTPAAGG